MSTLKLPKDVVADPRHDAVVQLLETRASLLWENGKQKVATLNMTEPLAAELRSALFAGFASQGLELITERLAREQRGLDALGEKAPESPQNARVSRLLFIANDGSPRFYRDCDVLLERYPQRLLACRLDLPGEELGTVLFGSPRMVRSVLVFDKKSASRALLALLPKE